MIQRSAAWRMVALAGLLAGVAPGWLQAQNGSQFFPETGQTVAGRFLSFWRGEGALPVFGYPLTAQRGEESRDTGQTYETQWFERNRFELHPENSAPYDVLLGRLGDDALKLQGRDWQAEGRVACGAIAVAASGATGASAADRCAGAGAHRARATRGAADPANAAALSSAERERLGDQHLLPAAWLAAIS